jgi:hypothetical protein
MNWTTKTKAEQYFKKLFTTKSSMANEMNISRTTLDVFLSTPSKMNGQIEKISKLKGISPLTIFKAINY